MTEKVEREFIPSLREGVDVVRMIFFKKMKEYLSEKYQSEKASYPGMIAGAMMNELFGTPNPTGNFGEFALANRETIENELHDVGSRLPDLCIPLTDALRIHFLCNHQEGIAGDNEEILKKARDYGILIEERDVPLPKGFMELVHRIGVSYGLLNSQ
ncbi:MAG: hypothetical protein H8E41_00640 [Desulfobulbaceae bacterium]|uniref:Uncharacterized protein n=1 Tax=Candidatus Desulfobia pelagia TaxID=2841692 RepID=A0A8J6N9X0_9BACT|nr:hypothetical protein [Candidatus Desulfobia pelagia]